MSLQKELSELLDGEVQDDPEILDTYSEDASIFKIIPSMVVFPKHTKDVQELVRYISKNKGTISLTARSAGTDMSGGPLTKSIVVSFLEYFNNFIKLENGLAVTQPGVMYKDFELETLKQNLLLPCYTASRELNTVGGMVSNNSAGEKSLTYGKTERYVAGLNVVLHDGHEYEFSKLSRSELEEKKQLDTFEGELYRDIEKLIIDNYDVLQKAKPLVAKNSAGYSLWNVWDKENDTFDLTQLFVGSQGTLGFITEITFRLVTPKTHSRMLVIFLRNKHMHELGKLVNDILQEKPESFESYDDHTFMIMMKVLPSLLKRLGRNPFALLRDFLPEIKMVLTGGVPKLVLLAEFTGDSEDEVVAKVRRAQEHVNSAYTIPTHVTRSKEESQKFWIIRRESFKILREKVHGKHTAPFIDDISVLPKHLPEFLPRLYGIMNEYDITYTIAGHIGDGNFHIIPLMNFSRSDFTEIIETLSKRVYDLVLEFDGSITGEHNDGLIRTPYLEQMYGSEVTALFSKIKDIFDPDRIFNPHKKVDPDMDMLRTSVKKDWN